MASNYDIDKFNTDLQHFAGDEAVRDLLVRHDTGTQARSQLVVAKQCIDMVTSMTVDSDASRFITANYTDVVVTTLKHVNRVSFDMLKK